MIPCYRIYNVYFPNLIFFLSLKMTQIPFFRDVHKGPWDIQVLRKLEGLGSVGSLKTRDIFGCVTVGILRNYT